MAKINLFLKKLVERARGLSIHLSIFIVTIFFLSVNVVYGGEINDTIVWTESKDFRSFDTKNADILLSRLTQVVPPLGSLQYGEAPKIITEGINFFDKPVLPNTIISGLPRDKITTYTVSEGETYWTIAYKFELDIDTLLWANSISDVNSVEVGKELIILPASGLLYTTTEGDTVQGVSDAFNVAVDKIKEKNDLDSNFLVADVQLFLPGARKTVPKPAVTPNYAGDNYYYTGAVQTGSGNFVWPVGSPSRYISQYFGWVTKYYKHTGLDMDSRNGFDIISADAGTVLVASYGWGGGYGNHVIIDHGNGYQTLYGHLSSIFVKPGDNVYRGQSIGVMGTTGISTGIHLHFEIRQNGIAINPLIYIQ